MFLLIYCFIPSWKICCQLTQFQNTVELLQSLSVNSVCNTNKKDDRQTFLGLPLVYTDSGWEAATYSLIAVVSLLVIFVLYILFLRQRFPLQCGGGDELNMPIYSTDTSEDDRTEQVSVLCRSLGAKRALSIFKDVSLRTRRALSLYIVYNAFLVLDETSLNSHSALLDLSWRREVEKFGKERKKKHFRQFV